ncbi:hypothetical protein [Burkholderia vietnamiensis]|uniref:ATP-binding protein n=1 Tax=Burkholderia vietnamiensis TaxID=60552 RepID=A0AAW7TGS7_BURVI|nr:hypothetical protein [Burkholderia vietnamiensis]MDN7800043.1 hypothetical protein [Burkholderia vietnamiensis]
MISFQQAVSLREIEAEYDAAGRDPILRIPLALRYGGAVGVPSALIQYVAAWSRLQTSSALRLYGHADSNPMEALAQEPHGLVSTYFAGSVEVPGREDPLSTREALSFGVSRIQAMQESQFRDTMRGRGVFLCCFARAKNEYLLPFYNRPQPGALRSRADFVSLTSKIITAIAGAGAAEWRVSEKAITSIGTLIYELFKNTDEHATVDENGKPYVRNVRALMAKFISYDREAQHEQVVSDDAVFNEYLAEHSAAHAAAGLGGDSPLQRTSFLELTVLDTGPGLVRRWMSRYGAPSAGALSIDEEVAIVERCFALHQTTKDTNASGGGLTYVLKTLSELNAYLRLRTGRICLVQDFSNTPSGVFEPKHWLEERRQLSHTVGASYSIVIPMTTAVPR